jgi:hypothetical protein
VARQSAEEARAQLSTETERARSAVRAEQDQAALMQKLEQFNLLRESNAQLRWAVAPCAAAAGTAAAATALSSYVVPLARTVFSSRAPLFRGASHTGEVVQWPGFHHVSKSWNGYLQLLVQRCPCKPSADITG